MAIVRLQGTWKGERAIIQEELKETQARDDKQDALTLAGASCIVTMPKEEHTRLHKDQIRAALEKMRETPLQILTSRSESNTVIPFEEYQECWKLLLSLGLPKKKPLHSTSLLDMVKDVVSFVKCQPLEPKLGGRIVTLQNQLAKIRKARDELFNRWESHWADFLTGEEDGMPAEWVRLTSDWARAANANYRAETDVLTKIARAHTKSKKEEKMEEREEIPSQEAMVKHQLEQLRKVRNELYDAWETYTEETHEDGPMNPEYQRLINDSLKAEAELLGLGTATKLDAEPECQTSKDATMCQNAKPKEEESKSCYLCKGSGMRWNQNCPACGGRGY